jgi:hypothetical protein
MRTAGRDAWLDDLPEQVREMIDHAIGELDQGVSFTHEEVVALFPGIDRHITGVS